MIRNFEKYTDDLNYEEKMFIMPRLTKLLLLAIGKEKALINSQIVKDFKINPIRYALNGDPIDLVRTVKTSEPRIRYMIHILRVSDTIPFLVASSAGYYISNDLQEIESYIGSIEDRLRSIYDIRRALKRQLKSKSHNETAIQQELLL